MNSAQLGAVLRRLGEVAPPSAETDAELLARYARGEQAAFVGLVTRYSGLVWSVGRRIVQRQQDREDVFQATFLALSRKCNSLKKECTLAPWLYTVTARLALNINRARKQESYLLEMAEPATLADPVVEASGRELAQAFDEEMERLPPKYRDAVVLCCLEGMSRDEAAAMVGSTLGAMKNRLERGRKLLKKRLERRGIAVPTTLLLVGLTNRVAPAAVCAAACRVYETDSPAVVALASKAIAGSTMMKTIIVSVALGLTAVGIGVGGSVVADPEPEPKASQAAAVAETRQPVKEDEAEQAKPRLDQRGDPLPPDAVTRLGTTRFFCGYSAMHLAFAQDGGKILAAGGGGALILDAMSGKHLHRVSTGAAKRSLESASLSPDGKLLALGGHGWSGESPCIQIWEVATGKILHECQDAGRQQYLGVRFSPDGKTLAAYSFPSKTLYLWDPATGKEISRWHCSGFGNSVAFSPDSKTLIAGDQRTIHFWDAVTGKEMRTISDHPGACIYRLVLARDGKTLATQALVEEPKIAVPYQYEKHVYLWDTATGKMIRQIEVVGDAGTRCAKAEPKRISEINHFDFSPDGKSLTTAGGDGVLRVWDVATGKELRRLDTSAWIYAFAFSPDGKTLASVGDGNTVRLWDASTGKEMREHPSHRNGFVDLTLSPDGRTLASVGGNFRSWGVDQDAEVRLWDMSTGRQLHRLTAARGDVYAPRFSRDGRTLTTLGDDEKCRIWEVATGKELRQLPAPFKGRGWRQALSPNRRTWATSFFDGGVVLWDASTGKVRQALNEKADSLAFSPDGEILYTWSRDEKVRLWGVGTGNMLREFAASARRGFRPGSFSPDGNWFACEGEEQELLLFDLATGNVLRRIKSSAKQGDFTTFAFSPDGRTLAVGDAEGNIHLAELASGKFRRRLTGGQGSITALLFSADGNRLISGSSDTTALVWDLTGRQSAKPKPLQAVELEFCWAHLADEDAEAAYQSIRRLASSPTDSLPYLEKKLQPTASADAKRVAELIHDLDSDNFAVRDQAFKDLVKLGETATATCRKSLVGETSAERRNRLEALLEKLKLVQEQNRRSPTMQQLRILRAMEVLECAGTPKARQLLERLAGGTAEAFMTREAKAAAERLASQPIMRP